MSSWSPEYEVALSDSEEESLLNNYVGRECIIFIVDGNLYGEAKLLENALWILRSAYLSGLLVNDKDLIGLIFANTKYSPDPYDANSLQNIFLPDNCAVYLPPRQLNTSIVKDFLRFVELAPANYKELYGVLPNGVSCNFANVLRLCMDLVEQCNYFVNNTTIVFLTDNELPHPYNSECYTQVLQKATDMKTKNVAFQLIPMIDEFNYDIFYKEFICLIHDIDVDCFRVPCPKTTREMLTNRKFKQHYVRRSLGCINFFLSSNLVLSARYFNYYQNQKKLVKSVLQRTDSAILQKHRITRVCKHELGLKSSSTIKDINIKNSWYEINLGSQSMRISYGQVNKIRNIHSPGMVLLGFKPVEFLNCTLFSKNAHFMYPDDFHIKGSRRLFRALWEKCIQKQKIAVCLFMCKWNSMPRYVALVPVDEDFAICKRKLISANSGFKIQYLSCNSYIRHLNLIDWNSVENQTYDEELSICEKLMKKFRLNFKADILCDPNSNQLQSKLLRLAFNVQYETLGSQYFPNPEDQNLRLSTILTAFNDIFGKDVADGENHLSDTHYCASRKKVKVSININNKDCIKQMIKEKKLNSCSKEELLKILEYINKKVSKNKTKNEMLDIIYNM